MFSTPSTTRKVLKYILVGKEKGEGKHQSWVTTVCQELFMNDLT